MRAALPFSGGTVEGSKDHKRTFGSDVVHTQSGLRDPRFKYAESSPDGESIHHIHTPSVRQVGELYIESSPLNIQAETSFSLSLPSM